MTYAELVEKRTRLGEKLEALQREIAEVEEQISSCSASVASYFPSSEILSPLVESLAFVREYEDEIYGKVTTRVSGFQFAFKDSPEVVYRSCKSTNHWMEDYHLNGEIEFNPSAIWDEFWELPNSKSSSQDEALLYVYKKELEKDRAEAVASLLWYNVGW